MAAERLQLTVLSRDRVVGGVRGVRVSAIVVVRSAVHVVYGVHASHTPSGGRD